MFYKKKKYFAVLKIHMFLLILKQQHQNMLMCLYFYLNKVTECGKVSMYCTACS